MTYSEFQTKYKDIHSLVLKKRLLEAIRILSGLIVNTSASELHNRYQSISDTYSNMIRYSFEFSPDPERQKIYRGLQQSLLQLTDDIRESWYRSMNLFERKPVLEELNNFESLYFNNSEFLVQSLLEKNPDTEAIHPEILVQQVFNYYWLLPKLSESHLSVFNEVLDHDEIAISKKALLVSAVTLSQLRQFDSSKFILLFDLSKHSNAAIRQRAMIGLFLSILASQDKILLYDNLVQRLKSIPDDKLFQDRMFALLLQFLRATETEKITRTIQEEIVPEVMKIRSDLEEKLNLDDLLSTENFEDKNPEWENFFKDSPDIYQKLEQFSQMQIEGADVFMGAFAMLKHFSFFKSMPNWFLPFTGENSEIREAFREIDDGIDNAKFLDGLEQSTVLCNSDKYSFCLNIKQMPAQQRKMMLELFNMELKAMNEMMEDEYKMNAESRNKFVNTQYFQDLYRFFKLYPFKKEYIPVFEQPVNVLNSEVLMIIFDDPKILRNLAEFHFAKDNYPMAIALFEWLNQKQSSFELLEKLGFCAQKLGEFERAISYYHKAELFDKNKVWLQKKLGFCYRKTGDFQKAISYYTDIIQTEPKDLTNLAYLGQLYIDIEDFAEALRYYYKVEYEDPKNIKVFRPIAWCSFVEGKYDNAIKYFNKAIQQSALKSDYLNIGHCYWAQGKIESALDMYRQAVQVSGNNVQWFRDAFSKDEKYLEKAGITQLDVLLMMDYTLLT